MTTEILTSPEIDELTITIPFEDIDAEDGDKFAHFVNPAMNLPFQQAFGAVESAQELVDTARFIGVEIVALCGYKFIPKHDPSPLKACERCAHIAGLIITEDG